MSEVNKKKTTKTVHLETLHPKNYRLWYVKSEATFDVNGLLSIVNGSETHPHAELLDPGQQIVAYSKLSEQDAATRKAIQKFEHRAGLARQALFNALEPAEMTKVQSLRNPHEIWQRLHDEYGAVSDVRRAHALTAFYTLRKQPDQPLKDHIDMFSKLQQEVDYHRPEGTPLLTEVAVNLAFLHSLGDDWGNYVQAMGERAHTIKTSVLFGEISALERPPASNASNSNSNSLTAPTTSGETTELSVAAKAFLSMIKDQRHGKPKHRNGKPLPLPSKKPKGGKVWKPGMQGYVECNHCHKPGHLWRDCRKRKREEGEKNNQRRNNNDEDETEYHRFANMTLYRALSIDSKLQSTPDVWIIDSASNTNLTPFKERLLNYVEFAAPKPITGLGGYDTFAYGSGSVRLMNSKGHVYTVNDVFYVRQSLYSILSLISLHRQGLKFAFKDLDANSDFDLDSPETGFCIAGTALEDILHIRDHYPRQTMAITTRAGANRGNQSDGGKMEIELEKPDVTKPASSRPIKRKKASSDTGPTSNQPITNGSITTNLSASPSPESPPTSERGFTNSLLWHYRLAHAAISTITKIPGINVTDTKHNSHCDACLRAKFTKLPFNQILYTANQKLLIIHSDLCGPFVTSLGKSAYYITFTDDFTRFVWVYTIPNKEASTIKSVFLQWKNKVELESGHKVKIVRTDGGGEYKKELTTYFESMGIQHELTSPYTPQSNGTAERLNRTLNEMVRAMLFQANMPETFWAEAVQQAVRIKNILPSSALENYKTPYEAYYGHSPSYKELKPFGCTLYAGVPKERRPKFSKLHPRANRGCYIATISNSGVYKYWDFTRRTFDTTHNAVFFEDDYPSKDDFETVPTVPANLPAKSPVFETVPTVSANLPVKTPVIQDSIEVQRPPATQSYLAKVFKAFSRRGRPLSASKRHPLTPMSVLIETIEPSTYKEAVNHPDASKWRQAMEDELQSIEHNKTWILCELPRGRKCIGSKWVFKVKKDGKGNIMRYKARLVAKGYSQLAGIDYDETYAPVVRIESARVLLAIAAFYGLHILQIDAKTAFLNGDSDLELYLEQPEGFVDQRYPTRVLRLRKSLYGLKQAPRIWYLLLYKYITLLGFKVLETDPSIYISDSKDVILAVYVDDILIFGKTKRSCELVFQSLSKHFKMESLGEPCTFLGLNIHRPHPHEISINHEGYINQMAKRFGLENSKSALTPLQHSLPLEEATEDDKLADPQQYQELVGSLNHCAVYSRPDIAFAVSQLSQFLHTPTVTHLKAARQTMRYLHATKHYRITYGGAKNLNIYGFADASWGGCLDTRKSTTGYIFLINNGAVSWTSHRQKTVALSTMEAEYMSLSDASREAIARAQMYTELGVKARPPLLHCDNQATLTIASNPVLYQRSKHIGIRYHFVRHAVQNEQIVTTYIPTKQQIADILTKALGPTLHRQCVNKVLKGGGSVEE